MINTNIIIPVNLIPYPFRVGAHPIMAVDGTNACFDKPHAIAVSSKLGGTLEIEHTPFILRFGNFGFMGQETPPLLSWSLCLLSVLCVCARASESIDLVGVPRGELIAPCAVTKRRVGISPSGALLVATLDTDRNLTAESLVAAHQWSYPYKPTTWFWSNPFLVYLRTREEDANVKELCFRNAWEELNKCASYALRCKSPVRLGSVVRRTAKQEHLLTLLVELDRWSSRPLHAHLFQDTRALLSIATSCEGCVDLLPAVRINDAVERTDYLLMQAVDESGNHRKTIWMDSEHNEVISSAVAEPPEIYEVKLEGVQSKPVTDMWNAERPQLHKLFAHGLRSLGSKYVLRGPIWARYCNLSSEHNLLESCKNDQCVDRSSVITLLKHNLSWENAIDTTEDSMTTIENESLRENETDERDESVVVTVRVPKSTPEVTPEPQSPGYSLTLLILLMTSALLLTACVVAFFSLRLHRRSCFWRKRRPYLSHLRSAKLNDPQERHSYAAVSTVTTRM